MKIGDILKTKKTISFEFFPPKTAEGEIELMNNLKRLEELSPDFASVTYGAGGSTREKTREIIEKISGDNLNVMAHLTCIGHTKEEIRDILTKYKEAGIENILALRGDIPQGSMIRPEDGEMPHTVDMIKEIKHYFGNDFSIGGAAFPERHPESPNMEWEIRYFKEKAEAGLDFAITQLFFDNRYYFELVDNAGKNGINIPIIPGIMPITNFKQIRKFSDMCNATIPQTLVEKLEKCGDNAEEVTKYGIEYAVKQCEELLAGGARGLHFYTLNKSKATTMIYEALGNKNNFGRIK